MKTESLLFIFVLNPCEEILVTLSFGVALKSSLNLVPFNKQTYAKLKNWFFSPTKHKWSLRDANIFFSKVKEMFKTGIPCQQF